MNITQRKYLRNRLTTIASARVNEHRIELQRQEPADIKEARAKLTKYEQDKRNLSDDYYKLVYAAKAAIEDQLFFAEEADALTAIRNFETMKF